MESVGVSKAVTVVVSTAVGVQVHVARPFIVVTEEHPAIEVPAILKLTTPGVLAAAEIVTGVP